MKKYLIVLMTAPLCCSFNFAEAQSDVKKIIEKEVEQKIDDETENKVKTIKIKIKDGEGEEKIMVWTGTDESEMSEEMKGHMEDGKSKRSEKIEKEINISVDDETGEMTKTIEIISEENGEKKVMKWKGGENDEMPEEIKVHMKDVHIIEVEDKDVKSTKKEKIVKLKIIEDGGEEKIIEWEGEGEMPKEMKEKLEKEGVKIKNGNVMIFKSDGNSDDNVVIMSQGNKKVKWDSDDDENIFILDDNKNDAKPKLGVMIENHVDGIEIRDVVKGSAAEKGGLKLGDVIFKIDDKYIGSTLQLTSYLDKVTNGEQIKIKVLRDGTEKTLKIDLDKKSK